MEKTEKIRNEKLRDRFNALYNAGDTVKYRTSPIVPYQDVTVTYKAFIIPSGHAVTFFNEVSGNHSIEPIFVKYPAEIEKEIEAEEMKQVKQPKKVAPVVIDLRWAILTVLKGWDTYHGHPKLLTEVNAILSVPVTEKEMRKMLTELNRNNDIRAIPIRDKVAGRMVGSGFFYNDKKLQP
jgi:hypothetical protein